MTVCIVDQYDLSWGEEGGGGRRRESSVVDGWICLCACEFERRRRSAYKICIVNKIEKK